MSWDPAALTITGLIATVLSLVFAAAAHATTTRRARERENLRRLLDAREQGNVQSPPPEASPTPSAAVATTAPSQPTGFRPGPAAPAAAAPPVIPASTEAPAPRRAPNSPITQFKRYAIAPRSLQPPPPGNASAQNPNELIWE